MSHLIKTDHDWVDLVQYEAEQMNQESPLDITHRFTEGMYIREMFAPKGSVIVSKMHKTNHPFTISKGVIEVSIDGIEWIRLESPFTGITYKGIRRVGRVLEDTVWTTYHNVPFITGEENDWSVEEQDKLLEKIEEVVIEPYQIQLTNIKQSLCHGQQLQ